MMEERRSAAIVGAAALAALVAFGYGMFLYLGGGFKSGYEVEATFARAGQLLRGGSDVKMRGVLVGSVRDVEVGRNGRARVTMLLDESQEVPADVSAAIRAKTLFGEKFIDLIAPPGASAGLLAEGDEIPLDRTIPPIEVETILEKGVPILEAVDPEAFAASLEALVRGLVGNEDALRRATLNGEKLLTETERTLPNLERNLIHLERFASALNATDTDLLDALEGLTRVGEVIRDHPDAFERTLASLGGLADDLGKVVRDREDDLAVLASEQRAILEEVRQRKDTLPGVVRSLDGFLGVWVADLTVGPYWRISVTDPPVLTGTPYGEGEAPAPRSASAAALRDDITAVDVLLDVLLTPLPAKERETATAKLAPLLGALR